LSDFARDFAPAHRVHVLDASHQGSPLPGWPEDLPTGKPT